MVIYPRYYHARERYGLCLFNARFSLSSTLGHTHIDILKIDIEVFEFETLTQIINAYRDAGKPLPFGQLQLEVCCFFLLSYNHHILKVFVQIHLWERTFAEFLTWWEQLEQAGLRPFWTEPNLVCLPFLIISLYVTN